MGGEVETQQRQTLLELSDIDAMVIASIDCLIHIKDAVEGYYVLEQAQQLLPLDKQVGISFVAASAEWPFCRR